MRQYTRTDLGSIVLSGYPIYLSLSLSTGTTELDHYTRAYEFLNFGKNISAVF